MDIEVVCACCDKKFYRRKADVNQSLKKGRKLYCSLACVGKDNNQHLEAWQSQGINLRQGGDTRSDDLSPFRWHLRNAKRRDPATCLTLEDLRDQWQQQQGLCPYTGWSLVNMKNLSQDSQLPTTPDRASLDRIDSNKGYTRDNIQFVSLMAQYAKNEWDGDKLLEFCQAVIAHHVTAS